MLDSLQFPHQASDHSQVNHFILSRELKVDLHDPKIWRVTTVKRIDTPETNCKDAKEWF